VDKRVMSAKKVVKSSLFGWVQQPDGEWEWKEERAAHGKAAPSTSVIQVDIEIAKATAAPKLPQGTFRPKQSLGQNFLQDGNTVRKIVKAFASDVQETTQHTWSNDKTVRAVELGPGAGAITNSLVETFSLEELQCIEIDPRAVQLLGESHPGLRVTLMDVLQVDYEELSKNEGGPLSVVGNLPYYITSQILFALADASHTGAVRSATVTMQWEVAQRIVAPTNCKAYGILSVVFQLYCKNCKLHFKIPPTVFYPKPKVDSALVGLHFCSPTELRHRLGGVSPIQLRRVLTSIFQQRRKTIRNSLKKLLVDEICQGDKDAASLLLMSVPEGLSSDWADLRPEQLTPEQFVQITKHIFKYQSINELGHKVWRKLKHGK